MPDHQHVDSQFPMASHFPPDINRRLFGALQVYPEGKLYEGLEPDEQIVLLIRRHPIVLLQPLLGGFALLVAVPAVIGVALFTETLIAHAVVLAWFLFTFAVYYFLSVFLRYMSDVWIATNERLIDMDTNMIGLKAASEVDLSAVAGASQVRGGGLFLGGIDRGAVLVRIIGEEDDLLPDVPMSGAVAQVIGELAEAVQLRRGSPLVQMDRERERR